MKFELMPMFWLLFTLLTYGFSRWLYRRTGRYLLSPLILVPALLLAVAVPLHTELPAAFFAALDACLARTGHAPAAHPYHPTAQ